MNQADLEIVRNRADAIQVAAHLRACDGAFVPSLSQRVDVDAYATKIVQRAVRFEAWSSQEMAGLVAVYCNAAERRTAFVTSVSVLPRLHGKGIASRLLDACVEYIREMDVERVELVVDTRNEAAKRLYKRHGFAVCCTQGRAQTMHLSI